MILIIKSLFHLEQLIHYTPASIDNESHDMETFCECEYGARKDAICWQIHWSTMAQIMVIIYDSKYLESIPKQLHRNTPNMLGKL